MTAQKKKEADIKDINIYTSGSHILMMHILYIYINSM